MFDRIKLNVKVPNQSLKKLLKLILAQSLRDAISTQSISSPKTPDKTQLLEILFTPAYGKTSDIT